MHIASSRPAVSRASWSCVLDDRRGGARRALSGAGVGGSRSAKHAGRAADETDDMIEGRTSLEATPQRVAKVLPTQGLLGPDDLLELRHFVSRQAMSPCLAGNESFELARLREGNAHLAQCLHADVVRVAHRRTYRINVAILHGDQRLGKLSQLSPIDKSLS